LPPLSLVNLGAEKEDVAKQQRFPLYAGVMFAATCGLAGFLALTGPAFDREGVGALLLLSALMIWSEHRAVEFADGTVISAGFLVMMTSVVAFDRSAVLLGPLLVGMSRGIYLPQLRSRSWSLIAVNSASTGLASLAAALTLQALPEAWVRHIPQALLVAIPTAAACVFAMWLVLAPAVHLRASQGWREIAMMFTPSALESLPFAVLGYFLGVLYLTIGWPAVLLIIVPMFIAQEVFASYMTVKASHDETVQMLIRALEAKDSYTAGHAERVAMYAQYIGEQMHFMPARMERLRFAALMHDIGKLVVPNHILNKPGKLTEDEFTRIKAHEKVSVQMLSNIEFLRPIAGAGHSDNTRFDPDDASHPIEPYIVMIADAYDAMTSTRAYRKALPQEVAFQELRDKAGIQFHPVCVEALIDAIEARGEKHGAGYEVQAEFENAPEMGLGSAGLGDLLPAEA
jgi:hypothetical protein